MEAVIKSTVGFFSLALPQKANMDNVMMRHESLLVSEMQSTHQTLSGFQSLQVGTKMFTA